MKIEFMKKTTKVQESGSNLYSNIPGAVRSVLKPEKGDILEWTIYDDRTVEIKKIDSE